MTDDAMTDDAQTPMPRPRPEPRTRDCGCPEYDGLSRRSFLRIAAAAGALAGLASEGLATRLAFAAGPYDGDVLVVLSLRGGFDGLQAIVPGGRPRLRDLAAERRDPASALIQLDGMFGMHPAMAPLKPLWDAGTLGAVHAVGMSEPNRSHFSAMEQMERAAPGTSAAHRMDRPDARASRRAGTPFQGTQVGEQHGRLGLPRPLPRARDVVRRFVRHRRGMGRRAARALGCRAPRSPRGRARRRSGQPARVALGALATAAELQEAGYLPENGAGYPDTYLGDALKDVARLIKAGVGLQVAAVDYGDWDMHAGMGRVDGGWMRDHLTELSGALSAFATDLGTRMSDVTLITLTEFGRRVEENGSGGTDHGHGQVVLAMGGGVVGGKVHGSWPGLAPGVAARRRRERDDRLPRPAGRGPREALSRRVGLGCVPGHRLRAGRHRHTPAVAAD